VEQSRPYRIRPLPEPAWLWQDKPRDGEARIQIEGPGAMASYVVQGRVDRIKVMASWGIGWRNYRWHRREMTGSAGIALTYPELGRESLGDVGVQRVWFRANGPKPKRMPKAVTITFTLGFLDGKRSSFTTIAKKGEISRPRLVLPPDENTQSPPASQ
jgi:hypothetical protein